jgi:hypothetical protein
MIRIYCDFNNGIDEARFSLSCHWSRVDLDRNHHELRDGLRVVLYQTGELEAEGTIHYDRDWNMWVGVPDWGGKYDDLLDELRR